MPDRKPGDGADVLSSLPATRPQRRSARRAPAPTEPARGRPAQAADGAPAGAATPPRGRPKDKRTPAAPAGKRTAAKTGSPKAAKPRSPRARPAGGGVHASGRTPTAVRPSAATRRAREPGSHTRSASAEETKALEARPLEGLELVNTTVQAAGELAQIGLSLTARAVRGVISRLPRP